MIHLFVMPPMSDQERLSRLLESLAPILRRLVIGSSDPRGDAEIARRILLLFAKLPSEFAPN